MCLPNSNVIILLLCCCVKSWLECFKIWYTSFPRLHSIFMQRALRRAITAKKVKIFLTFLTPPPLSFLTFCLVIISSRMKFPFSILGPELIFTIKIRIHTRWVGCLGFWKVWKILYFYFWNLPFGSLYFNPTRRGAFKQKWQFQHFFLSNWAQKFEFSYKPMRMPIIAFGGSWNGKKGFFEVKMTKIYILNPKLIVPDHNQQFWVNFDWF